MEYIGGKKEVIIFRKQIAPSTSNFLITERIKADCTIEEIRVRFYVGQQLSLEVLPRIKHKGRKYESFFTFPSQTNSILAGDDDYLVFPVSMDAEYDDEIEILVNNKDVTNTYTLAVDIVLDYANGMDRVVG